MVLWINLCKIRGYKYSGTISKNFGIGAKNGRSVDFPSLGY